MIFRPGDCVGVYALIGGRAVILTRPRPDVEMELFDRSPGQLLGEISLFLGRQVNEARACVDTLAVRIAAAPFLGAVNELMTGVNIALEDTPVDACLPLDANADEVVTIDEILVAVGHALTGCGKGGVTPTASPTPVGQLPDLVPADVSIAQAPARGCILDLGEVPRLEVGIRNQGAAPAAPFLISVNGEEFAPIDAPAAGAEECVNGPYVREGEAVVDSRNEVTEADEGNNARSFSLPIPTAPPPCTPTLTPSPTPTL